MSGRLEWFACYPEKLLGALAGMTTNEKVVYLIVLLRIYESNGPCRDSIDALAIRAGVSKKQVQAALDVLFRDGRLVQIEGGIHNPKAEQVIAESRALRERRQMAGSEGGKKRSEIIKENQENGPSKAKAGLKPKGTPLQEQIHKQKESKEKESPDDGWPEDYVEQFWIAFPRYRRQAKMLVTAKLAKLRASKAVEWPVLIEAVRRFAATNPGEFAPMPMTWLNGCRWDCEYENGGSNGKAQGYPTRTGFAGLAARLRHGTAAVQPDAGNPAADQQPPRGR